MEKAAICCTASVAYWQILLQKSFGGDERNFLGPLMRFVRRDVRDLIAHQKNGHGASYRRHRVLQRRSRLKFDFRGIFCVVRFSTFATLSAQSGPTQPTWRCPLLGVLCCKTRKSISPQNLAKLDFWTSPPLRRFSAPLGRSVVDFG